MTLKKSLIIGACAALIVTYIDVMADLNAAAEHPKHQESLLFIP